MAQLNDKQSLRRLGVTRRQLLEEIDRPALNALPDEPYEYSEWRVRRVGVDYHVDIDAHYYSVPYRFARAEVESWSRSSEQDSAKAKWTAAGVGPLQFRARGVTEGGRSPTGDTSCARRKIHAAAARGDGVK